MSKSVTSRLLTLALNSIAAWMCRPPSVEFLSDEVLRNRIALVDGVEHFLLRKFTTFASRSAKTFFAANRKLRIVKGEGEEGRTVVSESEDNTIASREEDILPMIKIQKLFQISFYGKAVFFGVRLYGKR